MLRAALLLLVTVFCAQPQEPRAIVRVEVKPSEGVQVTINGIPAVSSSVPLGPVEVKASKPGFLPVTTSVEATEPREYLVQIELQPAPERTDEVTVHATRTGTRLQDSPTRVEVLDAEEIEEKVMMTPGDIIMMLNETGGLRVQTTSPALGAASVRVQGMQGRYTRFLSDGLPLFGQQGGGLGLLQIPPLDLGQVEVIKGMSSALYGAGAMAGVVDLISRRPSDEPVHELLFNRTTRGATDGVFFLAQNHVSLLTGLHNQTRQDIDGDTWADLPAYTRGILRPRLFWDSGEHSFFLTGGITAENREGGSPSYVEALDTRRYDLGGSYQRTFGGRYVATARFSSSWQIHNHQFGEIRERDRHTLQFGEGTLRGANGRHTWVAGAAVERESYTPRDVPRFAYTYTTPGVFLQDDFDAAPWISFSASARADFHSQYGAFLSPRVAALLRWQGWTSRLSAGLGFFAPTPLTEETEAAGLTRLSIPTALRAERGRGASIDLTRSLGPASITATFFASNVSHPVYVERSPAYRLVNLDVPTRNRGFELLATWRKAPFSATANYAYVHARDFEEVPLTPRHSLGLTGMWEPGKAWRMGVELYYTGRQRLEENPYRSTSEPYISTGFLIERKFGPARLFLNAENLSNTRQTRWDPLLRPTRAPDGRWTVDAWAPLDGRTFNAGIRWAF